MRHRVTATQALGHEPVSAALNRPFQACSPSNTASSRERETVSRVPAVLQCCCLCLIPPLSSHGGFIPCGQLMEEEEFWPDTKWKWMVAALKKFPGRHCRRQMLLEEGILSSTSQKGSTFPRWRQRSRTTAPYLCTGLVVCLDAQENGKSKAGRLEVSIHVGGTCGWRFNSKHRMGR